MELAKSPSLRDEETFITGVKKKTKIYETEFDKDIELYKD